MPMAEACRQCVLAVEQRAGVGVFGEILAERLQRHVRFRITKLFAQQIAGAIDRTHAADAEQTFDPVTAAEYFRQLADRRLRFHWHWCSRGGRQGKVGEVAGLQLRCVHRRITTALRLSRAGPFNA